MLRNASSCTLYVTNLLQQKSYASAVKNLCKIYNLYVLHPVNFCKTFPSRNICHSSCFHEKVNTASDSPKSPTKESKFSFCSINLVFLCLFDVITFRDLSCVS